MICIQCRSVRHIFSSADLMLQIFGLKYHLVDISQDCSNCCPCVNIGHSQGGFYKFRQNTQFLQISITKLFLWILYHTFRVSNPGSLGPFFNVLQLKFLVPEKINGLKSSEVRFSFLFVEILHSNERLHGTQYGFSVILNL